MSETRLAFDLGSHAAREIDDECQAACNDVDAVILGRGASANRDGLFLGRLLRADHEALFDEFPPGEPGLRVIALVMAREVAKRFEKEVLRGALFARESLEKVLDAAV
jgi:hypothetical protein